MRPNREILEKLLAVIHSRRDYSVQAAAEAVANSGKRPVVYSESDLWQMVDGFVAVIAESINEQPPTMRSMFLETVIPGMVAAGDRYQAIMHTMANWAILVAADIKEYLPADSRSVALSWFSNFISEWQVAVTEASLMGK